MKRKLRLDVDDLRVDSFAPESGAFEAGTVRGHDSGYTNGTDPTCEGRPSCNAHNTCNYDSCDGVCGSYYCAPTDGASCQQVSCIRSEEHTSEL